VRWVVDPLFPKFSFITDTEGAAQLPFYDSTSISELMKTTLSIFIAFVFTFVSIDPASAQVLRRLQQKAADAVERKVEQKVDEKIEQMADRLVNNSFDAIFGEMGTNADGTPRKLPFTMGG
jgi:flagellar biosynthesis protein FlhB